MASNEGPDRYDGEDGQLVQVWDAYKDTKRMRNALQAEVKRLRGMISYALNIMIRIDPRVLRRVFNERDDAPVPECPICGHEWKRHDPEDGQCDCPATDGLDACKCGRSLTWMSAVIADLSRKAMQREAHMEDLRREREEEHGAEYARWRAEMDEASGVTAPPPVYEVEGKEQGNG